MIKDEQDRAEAVMTRQKAKWIVDAYDRAMDTHAGRGHSEAWGRYRDCCSMYAVEVARALLASTSLEAGEMGASPDPC